jgi:group I intron endonuclease
MIEVYCHTAPNGHRYVGLSARGIDARWREHVRASNRGSAHVFHRAIRKYGADAFEHELLERMTTEAGAKRAEQLWIERLGTQTPNGYNVSSGGESSAGAVRSPETRALLAVKCRGWTHTPEARVKIAEAQRGKPSRMLGRTQSVEARAKISSSQTGRAPTRGMSGRRHSDETRAKMSAAARRRVKGAQ